MTNDTSTDAGTNTNAKTKAAVQLKKNNFLDLITVEPMTKAQLDAALDGFEFIPSWVSYLTEHFEAQGKIVVNEDGTIQRKAKKGGSSGPRMAYLIEQDADTGSYIMTEQELKAGDTLDKEAGWATTKGKAIKNATSGVFQQYLADVATIKELLDEPELPTASK